MLVNADRQDLIQKILDELRNRPALPGLYMSSALRTDLTLKHLLINQSNAADDALEVVGAPAGFRRAADTEDRIQLDPSGGIGLGPGNDAPDWMLSRTGANQAAIGINDVLAFGPLGTMSLNADDTYGLAERAGTPLPVHRQSVTGQSGGVLSTTATATLANAAIVGNLLVFVVSAESLSVAPTFTTPTGFTLTAPVTNGIDALQIFFKVAAGGETAVSTTLSIGAYWDAVLIEIQNIAAATLDQNASNSAFGSTPTSGTTGATTQAVEYEVAAFNWGSGAAWSNITNGFSKVRSIQNYVGQPRLLVVDKTVAATGAASTGITLASSAPWIGRILTFKGTGASTGDPAAPPAGVRKAYAKTTGIYAENSAAVVERLSEPGLATPIVAQYSNATAAYTAISTFTVPANFLVAGRGTTFGIDLVGVVDNTVTAGTFTIALIWGGVAGVVLATIAVLTTTTAAAGRMWTLRGLVTCRTTGAAGVLQSSLAGFESSSTTTGVKTLVGSDVNTTAIDTTIAKDLVVASKWAAAVAGNIVKCDICPGFRLEKY